MKNSWKNTLGAVALSAVALGALAPTAFAYEEKGKGQHFDKGKGQVPPAANDPCKRPGTQCDPRDGGASTKRKKADTVKPNPHSGAPK